MLQPKKTKYRKAHKGRIHGAATSGTSLTFGQYGLKAVEPDRVKPLPREQLEPRIDQSLARRLNHGRPPHVV